MNPSPYSNDLIFIKVTDVANVFKKHKRKIVLRASLFALLAFFGLLLRPPQYHAESTFIQSTSKGNDIQGLKGLFKNLQLDSDKTDAIPLMFSRRLLGQTIEELGLQVIASGELIKKFSSRALCNFLREFGNTPTFGEHFLFQNTHYEGEIPLNFFLIFSDFKHFEVLDAQGNSLSHSILGTITQSPDFSFVLKKAPKNLLIGKKYSMRLLPKEETIKRILSSLEIKPNKINPRFLTLAFKHESRELSTVFLDTLMATYQKYLNQENEDSAKSQLTFLEKRQAHLNAEFKHTLQDYTRYLKANLKKNGVIGLTSQMELIAVPIENEYLTKLSAIALEKKRYEKKETDSPSNIQLASSRTAFLGSFHALNKETAQDLYIKYTQELDTLQIQLKQLTYLSEQIGDPLFEVTSLSSTLTDPVSQELIRKASDLALSLRDTTNRSEKEQERAHDMLRAQKRFLAQHLHEMSNLEKLRAKVLEEKLLSLRTSTLDLLTKEESELLEQLQAFREQISDFPDKWLLENEFKFKKKMNMNIMSAMTQLTESKIMQQLLFQVESKPLDIAYSPLKPKHPHLFLFGCIAGLIALFFQTTYYLIRRTW
jgi:hypothetical protein